MLSLAASPICRAADGTAALRAQIEVAKNAGDTAAVAELARRIVEQTPADAAAWETLVRSALELKQPERAAASLDRWEKVAGHAAPIVADLRGDVCAAQKNLECAEKNWRMFVGAKSTPAATAATWAKLGELFVQARRWNDNADAWTRAVAVRDTPANRAMLAGALLRARRWDAAAAEIKRANARDAADDTVKEWLPQFERLAKYLPRIKARDARIAKEPANVVALLDRARLLTIADQPLLALEDGERAMKAQPASMRARIQTAESLLDTGRPDDAAKLQVSAKLSRDREGHVSEKALDELSACDAALAANPRDAEALARRAKTLRELQQFVLALADARAAIDTNPSSAQAHLEAAHALGELDKNTEATEHIRAATKLNPNDADVWHYAGVLEAERANFDAAIEAQTKSLAIRESRAALQQREQCERRVGKIAEADADAQRLAGLPE